MAWRDLSRKEKIVVGVALFFAIWWLFGFTVSLAEAVATGQSPLSQPAFCVLGTEVNGAANTCTSEAQSAGGTSSSTSTANSGVQPADGPSWTCYTSPTCLATWIEGQLAGQFSAINSAIQAIENTVSTLSTDIQTLATDVANIPSDISTWVSSNFGTIWAGVQSFAETWLGGIVNAISASSQATINSILSAFQGAVGVVIQALETPFNFLEQLANQVASSFGPFAPVVVAVIISGIVVLAFVLAYLFVRVMFGAGKTLFNLL